MTHGAWLGALRMALRMTQDAWRMFGRIAHGTSRMLFPAQRERASENTSVVFGTVWELERLFLLCGEAQARKQAKTQVWRLDGVGT